MLSSYGFCDKAEPVGIECLRWESRRGEKSALRVERRCTDGRVSLPIHRFQALCVRIVEQHGARSTEQRYKKKSNYKRRTPDCVFLCRESTATAPPYNEMGSSSQSFCKVTKFRNNHKVQSQKHFASSKFIRTIRQHFTPTRTKNSSTISQKQRPSLQNSTALFTDAPPTALPTHPHPLLPLYARIRALSEFSFFTFTLHHPRYLPHSW